MREPHASPAHTLPIRGGAHDNHHFPSADDPFVERHVLKAEQSSGASLASAACAAAGSYSARSDARCARPRTRPLQHAARQLAGPRAHAKAACAAGRRALPPPPTPASPPSPSPPSVSLPPPSQPSPRLATWRARPCISAPTHHARPRPHAESLPPALCTGKCGGTSASPSRRRAAGQGGARSGGAWRRAARRGRAAACRGRGAAGARRAGPRGFVVWAAARPVPFDLCVFIRCKFVGNSRPGLGLSRGPGPRRARGRGRRARPRLRGDMVIWGMASTACFT